MARKLRYRVCKMCGKELPLKREFFKRSDDYTFHEICRECEEKNNKEKEWNGELLKCHKCGKFLPITEFGKSDHYPYRDYHDARCRVCRTKRANEIKEEFSDEEALRKLLQSRFLGARDRSKRQNLDFDITKEFLNELWVKQEGKCALSGIPMTYKHCNGRIPTNISIDQINSKKGYTKDNIQLVCMAVNQMKSDLDINELYNFCTAILENAKKWNHKKK